MITQILKIAIKNVFNKRNSSLLSMLGLTIAFLSIFYIYSYVSYELGYDSTHKKADRIYRVSGDIIATEDTMSHAILGPLMGPGLKQEFPEVEEFTRLSPFQQAITLAYNEEKFIVKEAYMADHSVFDIFTLEFIYGNKQDALVAPDQIVINQSLSEKIFGDNNPVGKTLELNNKLLTIKGVIKDSPGNVHHKLNVLISQPKVIPNDLNDVQQSEGYWMPSTYTFILLKDKCDITAITDNFDSFYNLHMAGFGKQINSRFNLIAIPLKDLHFSKYMSYDFPKGNKSYTYLLAFVALFIILIALLNYGNLIVFQTVINARVIGIKKIFGASRLNLFLQFLVNSLVFIGISVILALVAFRLTIPYSETITGISPENFFKGNGIFILSAILVLFASITSSTIPFINQFRKNGLLLINSKSSNSLKIKGLKLGKLVAIIQFSLSIVLIISSITISKQLSFLIDSDMGFDKDNVVLLKLPSAETNLSKVNAFKNELNASSLFANTSISSHILGDVLGSIHFQLNVEGKTVTKIVNTMNIDYDYIPLMGIKIKKGRNFNPDFKTDSKQSIIVNEAFIDYCGLDYDIVGSEINGVKLIGVLKNTCYNSLHTEAEPLLFLLNDDSKGYLNIKLNTTKVDEAIDSIEKSWATFFPGEPFEYQFLDQRVEMLYEDDLKKQTIIQLFTLVSFILSLMGFLNLATNISKQKTKEIAIRKVNGATMSEILIMLNRDFIKFVLVAFIIATPIAYYAMSKWLDGFANNIILSWWIFALSGLIAILIALTTASWLTYRAARRNPIESLKCE